MSEIVILSGLLFGAGAGLVGFVLARTRQVVTAAPTHIELALGERAIQEETPQVGFAYRIVEPLLKVAARIVRRLSPVKRIDLIRRRLTYAGMEATMSVEGILAYKAASAVAGFLFGFVFNPGRIPALAWGIILAFLASFVPDIILDSRAKARQGEIARDLPEALDLVAITVEAGLGLEQALEIVTENMKGPFAQELSRLLREIELGVPRRVALNGLRDRTDVSELSAFIVALIQADIMGMAIAQVLKIQAEQVRLKRRQRAREQAAKTPVKILFPLIFGIFPAIFTVTIGPGIINIIDALF